MRAFQSCQGVSLWTFLYLVCGHHIRSGKVEMLSCLNELKLCGIFLTEELSRSGCHSFFKTVRTSLTCLGVRAFQSCQVWYDDHRPKVKTFIDLLPGNFEMLSCLNELDWCGLFLTEWQPNLHHYSVLKSPTHSSVRALQSLANLPKVWITTNRWRSFYL